MKNATLLSIAVITFNQKKYIRKCLDSILMQKTNFSFEILVNDDASTDGTADILREYEAKHPELFKCLYQTENQYSKKKGILKNFIFPRITTKYVAICEGDDYWTDPLKLQKQVDFMESHPDFSICFHPVTVKYEDKSQPDSIFPSEKMLRGKKILDLNDLLRGNFIQTNSVMYHWRFHKESLDLIPDGILPMDWYIHLLHAQIGKIGFLSDVMSVYRRNQGGIWTGAWVSPQWFVRCGIPSVRFLINMQRQFNRDCSSEIERTAMLTRLCLSAAGKTDALAELKTVCSNIPKMPRFIRLKIFLYALATPFTFKKVRKEVRKRKKFLKEVIQLKKKIKENFV